MIAQPELTEPPSGPPLAYHSSLDGVRALAVLAVIGVHMSLPFAPGGGIGVLVFFVLSGFLITALLLDERGRTGTIHLGLFYARRGLRLLPALLLVLAAACAVSLTDRGTQLSRDTLHFAPSALLYFANWVRALNTSSPFVGGTLAHTWSLSVEEQFYLVWPVLLWLLLSRGVRLRTVAAVALVGAALSDVAKLVVWSGGSIVANANRMYGTDLAGDGLMLGCALAIAIKTQPRLTARVVRLAFWPSTIFLAWVVVFIHPLSGTFAQARIFETVTWPLVAAASAVTIGHLVLSPGSGPARVLGAPPIRYIGRISYGLYLWHYPVLIWLFLWFGLWNRWWQVPIEFGVAFLAASGSFHLIERRALRIKRHMTPSTVSGERPTSPRLGRAVHERGY